MVRWLLKAILVRQKSHELISLEQDIQSEHPHLQQQIRKWRHDQWDILPQICDCVAAVAPCEVEDECLFLPSDFAVGDHHCYNLEQLIVKEMKLWEGQAHDALRNLRAAIKYGRTLNQHRKDHIRKQGPITHAKEIIFDTHLKQTAQADKYQAAHAAMIRLGHIDDTFPELNDSDRYTKDTMVPHALGDGSKTEGWIWSIGPLGKMCDTEYEDWTKESEWYNWLCLSKLNALFQLTVCNGSVPKPICGTGRKNWKFLRRNSTGLCAHLTEWNLCGMSWLVYIQNGDILLMPMRSQLCIETWLRTAEKGSRQWEVHGREQGQV